MIFNAETPARRGAITKYLEAKINAPCVYAQVSTLGGVARASAIVKVSLDPRSKWQNGILQNSRYFMVSIDRSGTVEQFSGRIRGKVMRKSKAVSLADAVVRINRYISTVK